MIQIQIPMTKAVPLAVRRECKDERFEGIRMIIRLIILLIGVLLAHESLASDYVQLSDHFAIKSVSRSWLSGGYNEVFVRDKENGKFKLIGTTTASHWDKPFSGAELEALQTSVIAVSLDGNSLLYWHKNVKSILRPRKEEGVYWYRVGKGEKLLYEESKLVMSWHRYPKPIPRNLIVIKSPAWPSEELWALYADDASLKPLGLHGSTSLHMSVYQNDLKQVHSAIEQGMKINPYTYWGLTPLEISVLKGYDEIAKFLIEQGAEYGQNVSRTRSAKDGNLSTIKLAVRLQRWKVIAAIRRKGGRLDDPSLFHDAMYPRFYDPGFVSSNTSGYRSDDLPRMIAMILDDGADPNAEDISVIYDLLASDSIRGTKGQLGALKLLLERGASPDAVERYDQSTPLDLVASGWKWSDETKQVLDLLTSRMKSLEAKNKFGRTALQSAMQRPKLADGFRIAQYLIEAGANDTVEYLCGVMGHRTNKSIRQIMTEWGGKLPEHYNCSTGK